MTRLGVYVGHTFRLVGRPYFVTLEAPLKEFFEQNLRYRRKLPIHVLDNQYSNIPYKDLAQRRLEALEEAMKFDHDLFAEIAKMELNRWSNVNLKVILDSEEENGSPGLALVIDAHRDAVRGDVLITGDGELRVPDIAFQLAFRTCHANINAFHLAFHTGRNLVFSHGRHLCTSINISKQLAANTFFSRMLMRHHAT